MKKDSRQVADKGRRTFLSDSAMVGAGAAVMSALPGTAVADASETPEAKAASDAQQQGYHLTRHILDYYKTLS